MSSSTQIILLVILILGSAFFSGTEAALMSVNRIRIKNAAGNGNKKASLVLKFTENFDKVISTLLIGNNIVNILATSIPVCTVFVIPVLVEDADEVTDMLVSELGLDRDEVYKKVTKNTAAHSFYNYHKNCSVSIKN